MDAVTLALIVAFTSLLGTLIGHGVSIWNQVRTDRANRETTVLELAQQAGHQAVSQDSGEAAVGVATLSALRRVKPVAPTVLAVITAIYQQVVASEAAAYRERQGVLPGPRLELEEDW
jgi:hypothetical protein